MTAYLIVTYDVSDPDRFADYNPGSLREIGATVSKHGGQVLAGGLAETTLGEGTQKGVVLSFPSVDDAKAWQADEDYAPLKAIRLESTTNVTEFILQGV